MAAAITTWTHPAGLSDHRTGHVRACCSDNGSEGLVGRGSSGPWRGFYNTVMEGGIRTPCVMRWMGRIPRGQVSNEIVHELDIFPTIAAAAGVEMPKDRAIDGINILPFLEGKRATSGRESALFFTGSQVRAVKWKDWKFHYAYMPEPRVTEPPLMRLFNLRSDPREESDIKDVTHGRSGTLIPRADFTSSTQPIQTSAYARVPTHRGAPPLKSKDLNEEDCRVTPRMRRGFGWRVLGVIRASSRASALQRVDVIVL